MPGTGGLDGFVDFIADALQNGTPSDNDRDNTPALASWENLSRQLQTIQRGLEGVIQGHPDGRSCLTRIADVLSRTTRPVFLVWHDVSNGTFRTAAASDTISNDAQITPRITAAVQQLAKECVLQRKVQSAQISLAVTSNESNRPGTPASDITAVPVSPSTTADQKPLPVPGHVVSIPILVDAEIAGVLTTCFFADVYPRDWLTTIAEAAASAVGLSLTNQRTLDLERELAATAAIIDLAARVESAATAAASDSFAGATRVLCDELAKHVGCPQVVTGFCKGQRCRVLAISGSRETLDPERTRLFEAALDEVTIRESTIVWPAEQPTERHSLLTLKQLAAHEQHDCVLGIPIRDHVGQVLGAWLFLGDLGLRDERTHRDFIRACEHRLGTSLLLVKNSQRSRWTKLVRSIGAKSSRSLTKTLFAALMLVAAVLAVPIPYRVACDSELQPVTRRFVAAPFDGTLKQAHVEPGDVVLRNQLLATLDDREISIELRSIDADYLRAKKERDTHLAERDIAAAQLSGFDMDRLEQRRELLLYRTQNLEIRSPFDGLVLAGDLKNSEGVPLDIGQTLFEIAPLEQMLVELAIPEDDVRHVSVGQTVELRLAAFPDRELIGTLRRIHPRSEIRDEQNVFVGEIELKNTNAQLLPGMQGRAKIVAQPHSLAWIVFHKPIDSFLMWMGW